MLTGLEHLGGAAENGLQVQLKPFDEYRRLFEEAGSLFSCRVRNSDNFRIQITEIIHSFKCDQSDSSDSAAGEECAEHHGK